MGDEVRDGKMRGSRLQHPLIRLQHPIRTPESRLIIVFTHYKPLKGVRGVYNGAGMKRGGGEADVPPHTTISLQHPLYKTRNMRKVIFTHYKPFRGEKVV